MAHELVKLAFDIRHNNLGEFSKQDANETLRQELIKLAGTDRIDYKAMRKIKPEFFEIIEDTLSIMVEDGFTGSEFFNQYVDYRNEKLGDSRVFHISDNSLFNVAMIAEGNNVLRRQRLDSKSITVNTNLYGVKIYEELNRFLAGRIDWNELVTRVSASFQQKVFNDIYVGFKNGFSSLPATFAISGAYDEGGLVDLVQHVEAASGAATIIGTKNALRNVTTANVSEKAKEVMNDQGYFGVFNGTPMMALKQVHTPGTFNFALTDKDIYVVPGGIKPIKFVNEGETWMFDSQNTEGDESMEYMIKQRYGINIVISSYFGIYRLP